MRTHRPGSLPPISRDVTNFGLSVNSGTGRPKPWLRYSKIAMASLLGWLIMMILYLSWLFSVRVPSPFNSKNRLLEKSGLNQEWVASMTELVEDVEWCRGYMTWLEAEPVKTCDALVGCDQPVQVWVWFHGCDSLAMCKQHLRETVYDVNTTISEGLSSCKQCGKDFGYLGSVMKWRPI